MCFHDYKHCLHPFWHHSCPTCTRSAPPDSVWGIIDSGLAKWGQMRENGVFVIVFSSCPDLSSMPASLISLELLSATREAFTLPLDSSQEAVLHMSLLNQLRECHFTPFPRFHSWPNANQIPVLGSVSWWVSSLKCAEESFPTVPMWRKTILGAGCSELQEFMKRDPGWRWWLEISPGEYRQQRDNTVNVWKRHVIGWRGDWQVMNG